MTSSSTDDLESEKLDDASIALLVLQIAQVVTAVTAIVDGTVAVANNGHGDTVSISMQAAQS